MVQRKVAGVLEDTSSTFPISRTTHAQTFSAMVGIIARSLTSVSWIQIQRPEIVRFPDSMRGDPESKASGSSGSSSLRFLLRPVLGFEVRDDPTLIVSLSSARRLFGRVLRGARPSPASLPCWSPLCFWAPRTPASALVSFRSPSSFGLVMLVCQGRPGSRRGTSARRLVGRLLWVLPALSVHGVVVRREGGRTGGIAVSLHGVSLVA